MTPDSVERKVRAGLRFARLLQAYLPLPVSRWLLKQAISAQNIVVAGDSAGGNLTITTMMKLRDCGDPLPAAAACLSPAANLLDRGNGFNDPHVIADEELHQYATDLLDQSDAALFGCVTFQLMERSWPVVARSGNGPQEVVDFAPKLDRKPKYVSRTLDQVTWQNSFLLRGPDEVTPFEQKGRL